MGDTLWYTQYSFLLSLQLYQIIVQAFNSFCIAKKKQNIHSSKKGLKVVGNEK